MTRVTRNSVTCRHPSIHPFLQKQTKLNHFNSIQFNSVVRMENNNNNNNNNLRRRQYLILQPGNGGIRDLLRYGIFNNEASAAKFLHIHTNEEEDEDNDDIHRWVIIVSIIMMKLIRLFRKPLEWFGYVVDFLLNLLSLNGGLLNLLLNCFQGNLFIPERGSATFISTIGHIDARINLTSAFPFIDLLLQPGNNSLFDLSLMASKLAYENATVIKNVVNHHWKMHFVDFYNCWNEFQKESSTQVFLFCDKPRDANLIVISFRGTEPFDADDWITDFDYSWYHIPNLGKVHMGFLEAMGLGDRTNTSSFQQLTEDDKNVFPLMVEMSAYYVVRSKLKSLLEEHKNAKFMVTGHSLGGALAILFPTLLLWHEEEEVVLQRLLGVHTFGQPRVGNRELGRYVESKLQQPNPRYYRMVYCNDLVPRLPYDDKTFLYKHFGVCLYYDSFYVQRKVDEAPNRNYFGLLYLIPEYLNAVWELVRGIGMGIMYGPEYKESWEAILMRVIGLLIPGLSAHATPNYLNSIRLGTQTHIHL